MLNFKNNLAIQNIFHIFAMLKETNKVNNIFGKFDRRTT